MSNLIERVISKNSVKSIFNELRILKILYSNFIANIRVAFQDRKFLYLGLDLFNGGDLRFHLIQQRHFSENQSKFMIACVIQGKTTEIRKYHVKRV